MRNPGIDYADGRKVSSSVKTRLLTKVLKWLPKIRRLRKAGANTRLLVSNGLKPSLLYGCRVTAASLSFVLRSRAAAHSSLVRCSRGRTASIDLALLGGTKVDPGQALLSGPIVGLSHAWWDAWVLKGQILRTWSTARASALQRKAGKLAGSKVIGPLSAALFSAERIGWDTSKPGCFITRSGFRLSLTDVCPETIRQLSERDAAEYLLAHDVGRSRHLGALGGIPWLEPLEKNSFQQSAQIYGPASTQIR